MTNFLLRDKFHSDTSPVPFLSFVYLDYISSVYQICTATTPARNKNCTRTAKTAPYLSCHRDNFLPKVPGPVAGWLRQVTGHPSRQAPRYPDILCRDLTATPATWPLAKTAHWAVSTRSVLLPGRYKSLKNQTQ